MNTKEQCTRFLDAIEKMGVRDEEADAPRFYFEIEEFQMRVRSDDASLMALLSAATTYNLVGKILGCVTDEREIEGIGCDDTDWYSPEMAKDNGIDRPVTFRDYLKRKRTKIDLSTYV